MLKSNSKKANENIEKYVRSYVSEIFEEKEIETRAGLYQAIYKKFVAEKEPRSEYNKRFPERVVFEDWAQGLACDGLFCYYYNREAVDDLGEILEETEAEKAKFEESEAERFLTALIYREIRKAADKL